MEKHKDVRGRMVPVAALATAAVIATATAVAPTAVPQAAPPGAPVAVRQVVSLPVQLTAYNPVAPYAQPVGPLGLAITLPLAAATAVLQPVVQGATDVLTTLRLDPRLAQQPVLLHQNLVVPVAVGLQTALASALDGTYVYGRFTPIQAINFFLDSLRSAIEGTIAAQRALFGFPEVAGRASQPSPSSEDVTSPRLVDESETVTLSTAPGYEPGGELSPEPRIETDENIADARQALVATEDDAEGADGAHALTRPRFRLPALRFPTIKLPTLKLRDSSSVSEPEDEAPDAAAPDSIGTAGSGAPDGSNDNDGGGDTAPSGGQD